jgi:hypothetical protein
MNFKPCEMNPLSSLHGATAGSGCKRQPQAIEGSCEYVEEAFAGSRKGVVIQLGVGSKDNSLSP